MGDEPGPAAAQVFERERIDGDVAGHAFPLECPDDPLRRDDLAVLAPETILVNAFWSTVDEVVLAAGAEVHFAVGERILSRAPPVREVLACGVRLEDQLPGRIELAGHHYLAVRWQRY